MKQAKSPLPSGWRNQSSGGHPGDVACWPGAHSPSELETLGQSLGVMDRTEEDDGGLGAVAWEWPGSSPIVLRSGVILMCVCVRHLVVITDISVASFEAPQRLYLQSLDPQNYRLCPENEMISILQMEKQRLTEHVTSSGP